MKYHFRFQIQNRFQIDFRNQIKFSFFEHERYRFFEYRRFQFEHENRFKKRQLITKYVDLDSKYSNDFEKSVMNATFTKNNNIHEIDIYVKEICNVHKSSRANNIIKIITVVSL